MEFKEVVINCCYGGFSLSKKAVMLYAEKKGIKLYAWEYNGWLDCYTTVPEDVWTELCDVEQTKSFFDTLDIERHDEGLVEVVKELGEEANGRCAKLKVVKVYGPYRVKEYDGFESIEELDGLEDRFVDPFGG